MSAVAGLVAALEHLGRTYVSDGYDCCRECMRRPDGCNQSCTGRIARAALAAWRARPPLREDPALRDEVSSFMAFARMQSGVILPPLLDIIDARVLGLAAQPVPGEPGTNK